jgi:restriction system protein
MAPEERLAGLALTTLFLVVAWFLWLPNATSPLFVVAIVAGLAVIWWEAIRKFRATRASYEQRQELAALTPTEFEQWCAHRLRTLGYRVRHVGGQSDHGIDLFAEKDGELVVVQCKRFTGKRTVGEPHLRDLFGAMHAEGASRAIVITAGYFTDEARTWARGKPIELWDANRILIAPSSGALTSSVTPPIVKVSAAAIRCEQCGGDLVIRQNRSTGQTFYGCSQYPKCRFTRPMEAQSVV